MKKTVLSKVLKGVLMVSAAIIAVPHLVLAATDLNSIASQTSTEMETIPTLISICFYIAGAALTGSGLFKLKLYADNPVNTKLGEGVGRLSVGAAMLALPWIGSSLINTLGGTTTAPTFETFSTSGF